MWCWNRASRLSSHWGPPASCGPRYGWQVAGRARATRSRILRSSLRGQPLASHPKSVPALCTSAAACSMRRVTEGEAIVRDGPGWRSAAMAARRCGFRRMTDADIASRYDLRMLSQSKSAPTPDRRSGRSNRPDGMEPANLHHRETGERSRRPPAAHWLPGVHPFFTE